MHLQAMLFNLYGMGTPLFVYVHAWTLYSMQLYADMFIMRECKQTRYTKDHFSNALEEEVKDIEKEHQGLHLKFNNLVRNCQSIGTWNVVASKHLPPQ